MQVEEIHFNHNPGSLSGDAMTICRNGTSGAIVAPEWRRSPMKRDPAAYVRDAQAGAVTILAKFSGGPPNATVSIRAVDANAPPAQAPPGCMGWLVWFGQVLANAFFGTVGEVAATSVAFDGAGNSGLVAMTLNSKWLTPQGFVSKRNTVWQWQQLTGGSWTNFDVTEHTIYVTVAAPAAPWVQSGDVSQLPWADALDTACSWAVGAKTLDDVAARITDRVNRVPNVSYTPFTIFGHNTTYYLSSYLRELGEPDDFQMNCTDCADAVTTLANLLGCGLAEGRFGPLNTKTFLTLSGDPANAADWVAWDWGYHEICWLGDFASNTIWDGCLQLDMSNVPGTHVAQLPVKMTFDSASPDAYKARLIASGAGAAFPPVTHRRVE